MKSIYKIVHLHMKYQGERALINECNQVWDFHKPRDDSLVEPNIYLSQSSPWHIPSMNVGLKTKQNEVS